MRDLTQTRPGAIVTALGIAQTLAWGSTYYLPAVLAVPISAELDLPPSTVFAAFSLALILSALLGPISGRAIDRHGGRPILCATSVIFAAGLAALGCVTGPIGLFAAWLLLGIGMGCGLYEAAFATLVRYYGSQARNAITGITLIAGFASTVGWPLTALLDAQLGWRGACFVWAGLHLVIGLPLNAWLPGAGRRGDPAGQTAQGSAADGSAASEETVVAAAATTPAAPSAHQSRRVAWLLAYVFAVTWFISTAMAAHLPQLLTLSGATVTAAVAAGALIGPAQVAARLLEFGLLRRLHPLFSARLACLAHPLGAAALLVFGAPAAAIFAVLHGGGNGILTIAKGTLPLQLFGPDGYGRLQGLLSVPARLAQALAPFLFGVLLDRVGSDAIWFSAALSLSALAALLMIRGFDRAASG